MTKRKGFTLVELLIVVVIIGVLSSMMSVASVESTDAAKATAIIHAITVLTTVDNRIGCAHIQYMIMFTAVEHTPKKPYAANSLIFSIILSLIPIPSDLPSS